MNDCLKFKGVSFTDIQAENVDGVLVVDENVVTGLLQKEPLFFPFLAASNLS